MNKKPVGSNGYHGVGVSDPTSPASPHIEEEDFSRMQYIDIKEDPPLGAEGPKTTDGKRRRLVRGFVILATLAALAVGFLFWMTGSGSKKIDLAVRDRSAQPETTATQKTDDVTAQAIAEVRSGAAASPASSPAAAPSVTDAALGSAPVTIPLGGTVAAVESAPAPNATSASSTGATAQPTEMVSGRNSERSIRCATVRKDGAPLSKPPAIADRARATAGAATAPPPLAEKPVALPSFGALLPVRTLGAIYSLRPSLSRFELTRDLRGDGWTMKKGTVLVGQQNGSDLDRAYVSLIGFIDPNSGKLAPLTGDALGADGAPGLRGKRRQISSRWARVLGRVTTAAVTLGQAALSRGGTVVNLPGAFSPELQGLSPSAINSREFVEVPAGAMAFVLVTDLPKEARGIASQPVNDNGAGSSLGDEELANLLTGGSPEEIKAALPRMTPELRRIAESVLRQSGN
ncbi:MAG: hypothetical protein ACREA2_03240 [Blastocatellia bacterium]